MPMGDCYVQMLPCSPPFLTSFADSEEMRQEMRYFLYQEGNSSWMLQQNCFSKSVRQEMWSIKKRSGNIWSLLQSPQLYSHAHKTAITSSWQWGFSTMQMWSGSAR